MKNLKGIITALASAVVALGVLVGLVFSGMISVPQVYTVESHTVESQLVEAVKQSGEVALVNLSIQDIMDHTESGAFFGMKWGGFDKRTVLRSNFDAKLGIDGCAVQIAKVDEVWEVTIPEFIFIGYDKPEFQTILEQNGALSFGTPDIDTAELITKILGPDNQAQYLEKYESQLQASAEQFYLQLFTSIVPGEPIHFTFAS
jgi:hypothetical protein